MPARRDVVSWFGFLTEISGFSTAAMHRMAKSMASGLVESALLCVAALSNSKPKVLASRAIIVTSAYRKIGPGGVERSAQDARRYGHR